MKEAEVRRGDWLDPDAGKILFGAYADIWINDHVLKPRTEELYRGLLKNHLRPTFASVDLGQIRDGDVRRWRKERLTVGPKQPRPFGPVTVAKAYRLMHAIMTTAVEDGLIRRNPCHIIGAGQEHSDERPVIPVSTLVELLDNIPARYRALLLLATFANLRFGELAGLRRNHVDLDACEVRVNASTWEMDDGRLIDGDPKSHAGKRTVAFPADVLVPGQGSGRPARTPLPRPKAHREHNGGRAGRQPQGTDGTDGALKHAGSAHLPARHPRA
jgi:integrase